MRIRIEIADEFQLVYSDAVKEITATKSFGNVYGSQKQFEDDVVKFVLSQVRAFQAAGRVEA